MVIAARRNESGLRAEALRQLKAENPAVEVEGALEVGDFKVNVANANARIKRKVSHGKSERRQWRATRKREVGLTR